MEKITEDIKWKDTDPVQEPLDQPDLVSESTVDQYKQEKQAQNNALQQQQPAASSGSIPPVNQWTKPNPQPQTTPSYTAHQHNGPPTVLVGMFMLIIIGSFMMILMPTILNGVTTQALSSAAFPAGSAWNESATNISSNISNMAGLVQLGGIIMVMLGIVGILRQLMSVMIP